jgi:hypothetical protein
MPQRRKHAARDNPRRFSRDGIHVERRGEMIALVKGNDCLGRLRAADPGVETVGHVLSFLVAALKYSCLT